VVIQARVGEKAAMPYVVTIEFAAQAVAEAFFKKLEAEPAHRVPGAEITLPGGRRRGSITIWMSCWPSQAPAMPTIDLMCPPIPK
jgi:hypothetical protein